MAIWSLGYFFIHFSSQFSIATRKNTDFPLREAILKILRNLFEYNGEFLVKQYHDLKSRRRAMKTAWKDVVELITAIYLLLSPFILGFFHVVSASITFLLIGTAVLVISQLGIAKQQPWEEWTNLVLAILLAASPWLFGYYPVTIATASAAISGVILAVMAISAMVEEYSAIRHAEHHTHHGGLA